MERHTFAMKIKPGQMMNFRRQLGQVWSELTQILDKHCVRNFSMWSVEYLVFGYYETETNLVFDELAKEQMREWDSKYGFAYTWISTPFEGMRLMYHDFGVIRESKECIRHRVFITKLMDGKEEEYKARHDVLVKERGNQITKGPDSNFSIWYAGGYIFGYDEIDTTMEHEMTEQERIDTILWENQMLEIMTWITHDVDWITGECHSSIQRLCWHN